MSPEALAEKKFYYENWVLPQKARKMAEIREILQRVFGSICQAKIVSHIFACIAGAIGVGKSTVTENLSRVLEHKAFYEILPNFLGEFYQAMEDFEQAVIKMLHEPSDTNKAEFERIKQYTQEISFRLQIFFLHTRFDCHFNIQENEKDCEQDRSIYEDALFALLLYLEDKMSKSQLEAYLLGFVAFTKRLKPPTAIIYLYADLDTLLFRIEKRARGEESKLSPYYEIMLVEFYELFYEFFPCPVIKVNVSGLVDLTCLMENSWTKFMETVWLGVLDMKMAGTQDRRFHRLEIDFTKEIASQPLVSKNGNGSKRSEQQIILSNHDLGFGESTKPICQQTI